MFACNGILFNHESPVRGETFVTRKITRAVSAIAFAKKKILFIGNLDAKRDWGHAKDYVEAMWKMLQLDKPEDFVIATGITTTVRDFIKYCFNEVGFKIEFSGKGLKEIGVLKEIDLNKHFDVTKFNNISSHYEIGQVLVKVDAKYFRPTEVDLLIGDPTKAKNKLNWSPKYNLNSLVSDMMKSDIRIISKSLN